MKNNMKKNTETTSRQTGKNRTTGQFRQYAAATFAALAIAIPVALAQGFAFGQEGYRNAGCLSDGFFVAGALLTSVGILTWISNTGFFDLFAYAFHSLPVLFSALKKPEDHESYYDYKMMREEKRGKPLYFLVIVGAACLLLSVIFLGFYYGMSA